MIFLTLLFLLFKYYYLNTYFLRLLIQGSFHRTAQPSTLLPQRASQVYLGRFCWRGLALYYISITVYDFSWYSLNIKMLLLGIRSTREEPH